MECGISEIPDELVKKAEVIVHNVSYRPGTGDKVQKK